MRTKYLYVIQMVLVVILFVECYPNDNVIFDEYAETFMNPDDYDPKHPDPNSPAHNPFVDLGLSSGILWAEFNIGASAPTSMGKKFTYSPYIVSREWGEPWLQPSKSSYQELINECKWEAATVNGVKGYKAIGPNENSLFFPCSDDYYTKYYWTSTATTGFASCFIVGEHPKIDSGNESFNEEHYVRAYMNATDKLELGEKDIAISSEKQNVYINVSSSISTINASTDANWLIASVKGSIVSISCDENNTEEQRNAKVFITAGKLKRILKILQDGQNNVLEVSQTELEFDHKGGTKTINVTTNGEYKAVVSDDSWLSTSINGTQLQIKTEPNSTLSSKSNYVIVSTGTVSKKITINQGAANNIPEASFSSITVPVDQIVIKGTYNVYDASIKEYGIIETYTSSNTKPNLTLDSYVSISRWTTSSKKGNINLTINGNGHWYQNKDYYFFRIYIITTDSQIYYSEISDGVIPTSR